MLTKILLVTIFILLSWNSFQLSKSNEFLYHQIKQLSVNDESIENHLLNNKTLLTEHSKILDKNSKTLDKNSKLSERNQETLNQFIVENKHTTALKNIKATIDKIQSSVSKQLTSSTEIKKVLTENKQFVDKQLNFLTENKKVLAENKKTVLEIKKTILEIKKTTYKISDQIKKHAVNLSKHSGTPATLHIGKEITPNVNKEYVYKKPVDKKTVNKKTVNIKPVNKKKNDSKSKVKKPIISSDSSPFKKLAIEFYKTKELHRKKDMEKALIQLSTFKTEVWKSRKFKNISIELVMSILASIDITKSKWINKENNYNLDKVETKINNLFSNLGFYK